MGSGSLHDLAKGHKTARGLRWDLKCVLLDSPKSRFKGRERWNVEASNQSTAEWKRKESQEVAGKGGSLRALSLVWTSQQQQNLCARLKANHFACMASFNSYSSPERLLLFLWCRWEKGPKKELIRRSLNCGRLIPGPVPFDQKIVLWHTRLNVFPDNLGNLFSILCPNLHFRSPRSRPVVSTAGFVKLRLCFWAHSEETTRWQYNITQFTHGGVGEVCTFPTAFHRSGGKVRERNPWP